MAGLQVLNESEFCNRLTASDRMVNESLVYAAIHEPQLASTARDVVKYTQEVLAETKVLPILTTPGRH